MSWVENFKHYEKLLALFPTVKRKGKTMPYTSLNGHMFSFLNKEAELGLRLPEEERNKFIKNHDSKLMEQHGKVMKEYVVIPQELLESPEKLSEYFKLSYDYVEQLKPKSTKRTK